MQNKKSKSAKCPICGQPPLAEFHPFCSRGCRDRDLLNWLGEGYKVAGPPAHDELEESRQNGVDNDL